MATIIEEGPFPSTKDYNFPDKFTLPATEYQSYDGNLTLYRKMPFDSDYNNTVAFQTEALQAWYFQNTDNIVAEFGSAQYIRHSADSFKVNANMNEIASCNYLRFFNANSSPSVGPVNEAHPYYAFVTNVEYLSKKTCIVYFKLDVMQTYLFNFRFKECFIERMHVPKSQDKPGKWLLDEGLPCGERMQYDKYSLDGHAPFSSGLYYNVIFYADVNNVPAPVSSDVWSKNFDSDGIKGVASNVMSGIKIEVYSDPEKCSARLDAITAAGASDSVICVVQVPGAVAQRNYFENDFQGDRESDLVQVDNNPFNYTSGLGYLGKFGNYTPKNNKLFTSSYYGLLATSSSGDTHTYAFEDFDGSSFIGGTDNSCYFRYYYSLSPTPSVSAVPVNYRGVDNMYEDEIECSDFPQCVYATDSYRAWVAQNSNRVQFGIKQAGVNRDFSNAYNIQSLGQGAVSNVLGLTSSAASLYMGVAGKFGTGTGANTGLTGLVNNTLGLAKNVADYGLNKEKIASDYQMALGSMQAQILDAQKLPDKSRGSAGAYANYTRNTVGFMFYKYHIKEEFARIIDKFFDFYGYKVNTIAVPNTLTRAHWTFLKTAVCNIENLGMPCQYEETIRQIMNKGITFWVDPDEVGNYSLNNNVDY